jgi:hypothetical protein
MGPPDDESPASAAQLLIAETLRVPLDKTVRDAFTPRQKALLRELVDLESARRTADATQNGTAG